MKKAVEKKITIVVRSITKPQKVFSENSILEMEEKHSRFHIEDLF